MAKQIDFIMQDGRNIFDYIREETKNVQTEEIRKIVQEELSKYSTYLTAHNLVKKSVRKIITSYKKKLGVIEEAEATQFKKDNWEDVYRFINDQNANLEKHVFSPGCRGTLKLTTTDGEVIVNLNDWIIKKVVKKHFEEHNPDEDKIRLKCIKTRFDNGRVLFMRDRIYDITILMPRQSAYPYAKHYFVITDRGGAILLNKDELIEHFEYIDRRKSE